MLFQGLKRGCIHAAGPPGAFSGAKTGCECVYYRTVPGDWREERNRRSRRFKKRAASARRKAVCWANATRVRSTAALGAWRRGRAAQGRRELAPRRERANDPAGRALLADNARRASRWDSARTTQKKGRAGHAATPRPRATAIARPFHCIRPSCVGRSRNPREQKKQATAARPRRESLGESRRQKGPPT